MSATTEQDTSFEAGKLAGKIELANDLIEFLGNYKRKISNEYQKTGTTDNA